ncbi:hypothetical protein F4779DRAFT_590540 [Xylariaceae sp. FL0662B]|nr:hypothetical protein F4779DRAFT_590540 [Xylariaceae sp. FL0662B]
MLSSKIAQIFALVAGLIIIPAHASLTQRPKQADLPLPSRVIAQLNETPTFLENIAIRENGDLLVTMFWPSANIYLVEGPYSNAPKLSILHTIDNANGLNGIAKTGLDTFVVSAARFQDLGTPEPNSTALWEISGQGPSARKIVDIPEAGLLNGMAAIPNIAPAVLSGDGTAGVIYRVDVTSGQHEVVLDVPELKTVSGHTPNIGVNGVKVHDNYLYWSNTDLVAIYRVPIDSNGYPVSGAGVEKVAALEGAAAVDDFTFDEQGNIWAATDSDNTVVTIFTNGTQVVTVGSPTELTIASDTAVEFGQTPQDSHILYITTAGGIVNPVNGTLTEPAKIVAADARNFY